MSGFFIGLESAAGDLRYGARVLWRDRAAMGAAGLSLALALGACSTAFSLLDALLLRPLPVYHPESLVYAAWPDQQMNAPPGIRREHDSFSYPLFQLFRQAAPAGTDLFGVLPGNGLQPAAFDNAESEPVRVDALSGNAFGVLGIQPSLGRLIATADDTRGASPVAVISHPFWRNRFAADLSVLGRSVTLAGTTFRIVGVAREGFDGLQPGYLTDVWIPLTASVDAKTLASPTSTWVNVWGRDNHGAGLAASLRTVFAHFQRDHTPANAPPRPVPALLFHSAKTGADSLFRRQFSHPLWIFGIFSALLLLIATTNVANLFLARGVGREREMALRMAIGAGRTRLLRQLFAESALLALASTALAVAIGATAAPYLARQLGPSTFPAYLSVKPDLRLLGVMALAGTVATLFFGMLPALRASAVNPDEALKSSAKQSGSTGALRPLLPVQVAFSFMVLFLAGLLLVSFTKLLHVDLGFAKDNVLLFTLNVTDVKPTLQRTVETSLLEHLAHTPGVRAASLSQQGPIGGAFAFISTPFIRFPGRETETLRPRSIPVSPGYFAAMQIPLLGGREFDRRDVEAETTSSVIVNRAFSDHFFPGRNVLGQRFEQTGDDGPQPREIVGVVANSLFNNLREPVTPTLYSPLQSLRGATLEVRTQTDPAPLSAMLRKEVESVHASLQVRSAILQSTRIDDTLIGERLLAWIAGFFAVAAMVLVAVGLHGVISYFVVRRTKDIGIRMALGAERAGVVRLIVSDVAALIALGVAAGAAAGLALSRYAASLLFEVKPTELQSLAAPLVVLLFACALAALRPVLRATRIDPVIALRDE